MKDCAVRFGAYMARSQLERLCCALADKLRLGRTATFLSRSWRERNLTDKPKLGRTVTSLSKPDCAAQVSTMKDGAAQVCTMKDYAV